MTRSCEFHFAGKPQDTFSWAWYNGSYAMAAKPINSLELHYIIMTQFLIRSDVIQLKHI